MFYRTHLVLQHEPADPAEKRAGWTRDDLFRALRPERWCGGRGVETGWFDRSVVVVNHRNVPVDLSALLADGAEADWQYPVGGNVLIPHAAVCVGLKG